MGTFCRGWLAQWKNIRLQNERTRFYSQRKIWIFERETEKFTHIKYNAPRSKIRQENKKTATFNGDKTQFHCCKRISQIWINRPQISDSLSPLNGVANKSQNIGPDTGEQSPEEGRGIKKMGIFYVLRWELFSSGLKPHLLNSVTYFISLKVSKRSWYLDNSLNIRAKDWLKDTFTAHS